MEQFDVNEYDFTPTKRDIFRLKMFAIASKIWLPLLITIIAPGIVYAFGDFMVYQFFFGYPVEPTFQFKRWIILCLVAISLFFFFFIILVVGIVRMDNPFPFLRSKHQHLKAMEEIWELNENKELLRNRVEIDIANRVQSSPITSMPGKRLYDYCVTTLKKYGYKIQNEKAIVISILVVPSLVVLYSFVPLFIKGYQIKEDCDMRCTKTQQQIKSDLSQYFDGGGFTYYYNDYSQGPIYGESLSIDLSVSGEVISLRYMVSVNNDLSWEEKLEAIDDSFNSLYEKTKNLTVPSAARLLEISPASYQIFRELTDEYDIDSNYYHPSSDITISVYHDYYNHDEFSICIKG